MEKDSKIKLQRLAKDLEAIQQNLVAFQKKRKGLTSSLHPYFIESANNLLHYLALRQMDLKNLQLELAHYGLSSLGRCESRVMIARGDLGVEVGFERMVEVQEEILWLCEAAHIPVIWATQVLEGIAKNGHPTRAEVTDAASSVRAECVMLNKGPYIEAAVLSLDNLLKRMEFHTYKKRNLYRELKIAKLF